MYIHTYTYTHFHAHLDAHIAAATLLRPLVQRIVNHIMAFWYVLCACEVVCPQTQPHNTSEQKCANGVRRHVKCANIRAATQGECARWDAGMSGVVASSADRIGLWRASAMQLVYELTCGRSSTTPAPYLSVPYIFGSRLVQHAEFPRLHVLQPPGFPAATSEPARRWQQHTSPNRQRLLEK